MRIAVPYTYEAEAKNVSGVTRTNDMDASYVAEIREVEASDAPVVLRHGGFFNQRPTGDAPALGFRPPVGPLADVRLVDGRLYEQVVWAEDGTRTPATVDDLSRPEALFRDIPYVARRADAPDAKYWNEGGKTVYEKTQRESALESLRDAVDLVSVDGILYRASPEPVFVFDEDDNPTRPRDRTKPRIGKVGRYMHSPTFRLDDADLVAALALARGASPDVAAAVAGMAEVLDASALSPEVTEHAIADAGRRLSRRAGWDLHFRDVATMLAYADLSEATEHGSGERDPGAVLDAMEAYCAAVDAEPAWDGDRRKIDPHRTVAEARSEMAAYARRRPVREAGHELSGFSPDA